MSKFPIIRTIYLYLFSLVGLVLLIIGSVGFLNMGLKAFVFTAAENEERLWRMEPPMYYERSIDEVESLKASENLSEEQLESVDMWLEDYERWQQMQDDVDPVIASRHRNAAMDLALLLVGLPLFLFHWLTIRKENKK